MSLLPCRTTAKGRHSGAAVLGFISSGKLKSIADTAELVHAKKVYTPQAGNAETYKSCTVFFEQLMIILFAAVYSDYGIPEEIISQGGDTYMAKDIGVVGMAVMGSNLALNMADHGFDVAVYNYTPDLTEKFVAERPHEKNYALL